MIETGPAGAAAGFHSIGAWIAAGSIGLIWGGGAIRGVAARSVMTTVMPTRVSPYSRWANSNGSLMHPCEAG